MAQVQQFKALFTVSDHASKELKNMQRTFKSFAKSADIFRKNVTSLGTLTLAPLAGAFAGLGAVVKNSVSSFIDYGTSLNDTAYKLGMTTKELVSLQHAADMAGSSAEAMNSGLATFSRNLANAGQGKNKQLEDMMKKLGISMKDASGHMRTAAELMPELADAMKRQETQAQKNYIATTAFGKAGMELIQTLDGGSDSLKSAADEAERLGLVLSAEASKSVAELDDSMNLMRKSVQGLQNSIGSKLAPVLTPIINGMTDWIATNREWIAQDLASMVSDFADSLKEINFRDIIAGITDFIRTGARMFTMMGGLKTVAIAVGALFGAKLVASVVSTTSALFGMVKAFGVLVPAVVSGMKAITAAFMTNPIGLILVGITTAVGLLIANWETVGPFFKGLWNGITDIFMGAWNSIKGFMGDIGDLAGALFDGDWGTVASKFGDVFTDIVSMLSSALIAPFKAIWGGFKALFPDTANSIVDALKGLPNFFRELWESIKAAFFDNIMKAFDTLSDAWNGVQNFAGNAWDGVKNFFKGDDDRPERDRPQRAPYFPTDVAQQTESSNERPYFPSDVAQQTMVPSNAADYSQNNFDGTLRIEVDTAPGVDANVTEKRSNNSSMKLDTSRINTGNLR